MRSSNRLLPMALIAGLIGLSNAPAAELQPTASGLWVSLAPNGQLFVVKEDHSTPLVAINTWFRVGGRNERPEDEGISHFLEHMLFDGTTTRSKEEIDRFLFQHGAQDNAATRYDSTNYYITGPSEHFQPFVDLHADMLISPALLDAEFTREREVVKEELRRAQDNPGGWLYRQIISATFPHLNYDHQVLGSMETLNGQSNQQMRDYFASHYGPNNAITIVTGDVHGPEALTMLKGAFGHWERKELPAEFSKGNDPQKSPRTLAFEGDFQTTQQMLVFKAPEFAEPTTYANDLLMAILGSGESSRLTRVLRDEQKLVSAISASNSSLIDASPLILRWDLIDPAQAGPATNAVLAELSRIRREGPTPEELARAKRQMTIGRVFEQETLLGVSNAIGFTATALGLTNYEEYMDRIAGVTLQDVQWAAQEYLTSGNATLGIIGPRGTSVVTPMWETLDGPITRLIAPSDLGRKGQNPLGAPIPWGESEGAGDELYTLPNGLEVYLRPSLANTTIAVNLSIKGGLQWESWDSAGLATLTMDSLTRGTTTRDARAISALIDELGGSVGASAGRERLTISGLVLAADAERGLGLIADLAMNPSFPADEVTTLVSQQLQGLKAQEDDPGTVAQNQLRYAMYGPDHAYGRPYTGRPSIVGGLTRADCARFHQQVVHPGNAVLAVVGSFETDDMKAQIAELFGGWTGGATAAPLPLADPVVPTMPEGTRRIATIKDKAQSFIYFGLPGVGATDDDLPRLTVLNTVLGSSSNARLFSRLRGKEGLAYSTYSSLFVGQGSGGLFAYIATRPEMYEQAVAGMRREMTLLATEGPTEEEFADALVYLRGIEAQRHQGHAALADFAAGNLARNLPVDYELQLLEKVQAVTLDEVKSAATEYLDITNLWVSATGPLYDPPAVLE